MKTILSIVLSLLITSSQAGFDEALDAFDKGDHKTAIFNFQEVLKDKEYENMKDLTYRMLGTVYLYAGDDIDGDYKLTFDAFSKAANTYDEFVYLMLGDLYLFGKGVEQDYTKAKANFELAIKHKEYKYALWRLGKMYLHGVGVDQNYHKAKDLFLRADALDEGNSQFELAHIYEYGKGVKKDIDKALEYYKKAEKHGDADATYKINLLEGRIANNRRNIAFEKALDYTYGYTVKVNFDKAIEYYQIGAKNNHSASLYNIGFLIDQNSTTKKNTEATQYFLQSAELGNVYAQSIMATKYLFGTDVPVDKEKSAYWEEKAAKQGNIVSIKEVAKNYYGGGFGVDKNFKEAIKWYQKAVDAGDKESIYLLGKMHENGEGFDKDFDKALELYTKAAELGYDEAQNELADIYFKGERASIDYKKAFKWTKKAAEQGFADAQNKMGIFYSSGKNVVEIDMDKSFEWLKKAAEQGNTKSYNNLGGFYANGVGVKKDKKEAFKWYEKGAKDRDATSQYELGKFYDYGNVVQKDVNEAIKWYKKSADQNNKDAQIALGTTYYYGDKDNSIPKNYKKAADWYYDAATNTETDKATAELQITSSGSGFFVTPTHIITNNHVTAGCDEIEVKNKTYNSSVRLLDTDATTDLSILTTGKPNDSFLYLRNRKPVVTGEQSIALGYPFSSTLGSELKVTSGNIAALTGFKNNIAELQLTSPVQPGNSGGPLVDDNGNVIGVIVSRLETSSEITGKRAAQNVNFAIKSNMAKIFMDLNMVDYQVRKSNGAKKISQIVTEAKEATVQVICKEKE